MSDLFLELFNRAMAAGWVVLAVFLLRILLKKAPRWIHCGLWALVGLRLVWPFSWESVVSLLPSREVLPPEVLYDRAPEIHTGIGFVNTAVNRSFTPAMTAAEMTSVNPLQVWTWVAGWIWAMGAAALLAYALVSFLRLRKRAAVFLEEDGLRRCDGIGSPFILGVFRPRIYVPSDLPAEVLAHVKAHEQAHLRRKDHWWKPLGWVLLAVFWFQPLLWAAYILLCRDIESACDEAVVKTMTEEEKKSYSMALVRCAMDRRAIAACPVAFGEVGVKQRVRAVLRYKKPAFWVVIIAVVLCIAAAVCLLTDPVEKPEAAEPDPLAEGSAYITTECVFLNPLSSAWAGADSGYYYYIKDGYLITGLRSAMTEAPVGKPVGDWQEWPFTEGEWAEKFWITPVAVSGYTERLYRPLNETTYLLSMDGQLWLVEERGEAGIWSIFALSRTENLESARWSYMEGVDAEHRPMVLQFDLEYDRLHLDCDVGQIFGATTNVNYEEKIYYAKQTEVIYWTPLNEDGTSAPDRAEISFAVEYGGEITAEGVLTIDRQGQCGIRGSGAPDGSVTVLDSDGKVLFMAGLPAGGQPVEPDLPVDNQVYRTAMDLQPGDVLAVSHHNGWETIDLEELRVLLQEAVRNPVAEPEQYWGIWSVDVLLGEDWAIHMEAGLAENKVALLSGDEWLYVENEALYRLVRTCHDTPPAGVDEAGYALCRELVDTHLNDIPELPMGIKKEQVTKELTGFVLYDSSERLNAQAWRMDVAWNVDPPELAYGLCAGASRVNSDLQLIGANASETFVIVVDGEPVGFTGWWFLMDKTLDEQFETKDALIEAVKHDG